MLDRRRIEHYRRMTFEERWREVEELMTLAWRDLQARPREERDRILRILREEHDRADRLWREELGRREGRIGKDRA